MLKKLLLEKKEKNVKEFEAMRLKAIKKFTETLEESPDDVYFNTTINKWCLIKNDLEFVYTESYTDFPSILLINDKCPRCGIYLTRKIYEKEQLYDKLKTKTTERHHFGLTGKYCCEVLKEEEKYDYLLLDKIINNLLPLTYSNSNANINLTDLIFDTKLILKFFIDNYLSFTYKDQLYYADNSIPTVQHDLDVLTKIINRLGSDYVIEKVKIIARENKK